MDKKLFHVSMHGFGSSTWCGIPIKPWGAKYDKKSPNWGGSSPYSSTTCIKCIKQYIKYTKYNLNEAEKLLVKFK